MSFQWKKLPVDIKKLCRKMKGQMAEVYLYLAASRDAVTGKVTLSAKEIGEDLGQGTRSVQRHLSSLCDLLVITRENNWSERGQDSNTYVVAMDLTEALRKAYPTPPLAHTPTPPLAVTAPVYATIGVPPTPPLAHTPTPPLAHHIGMLDTKELDSQLDGAERELNPEENALATGLLRPEEIVAPDPKREDEFKALKRKVQQCRTKSDDQGSKALSIHEEDQLRGLRDTHGFEPVLAAIVSIADKTWYVTIDQIKRALKGQLPNFDQSVKPAQVRLSAPSHAHLAKVPSNPSRRVTPEELKQLQEEGKL